MRTTCHRTQPLQRAAAALAAEQEMRKQQYEALAAVVQQRTDTLYVVAMRVRKVTVVR